MEKTFIYINHPDKGKPFKDGWKEVRFDQDATIALADSDTTPVRSANLPQDILTCATSEQVHD
jgi:hypothetical protein